MNFLHNKNLPIIKKEWMGNPIKEGRFQNLGKPIDTRFSKVLRWAMTPNPQRAEKKTDSWQLPITKHPVNHDGDYISWIGHATFLIKLGNTVLITDPMMNNLPVMKRKVQVPYNFDELPKIDYILLSHDHRDHCDENSLKQITARSNPEILTTLNLDGLLKRWLPQTIIQTAGWYQQYHLNESGLEIFQLPARHWSKRGLFDDHQRLWGSFLIRYKDLTIYFSGDSGYDAHFGDIKILFPKIDIALMPIGAYKPSWMMKEVHMNPQESHRAFQDLGAELFVPMHYGVFDLADEPMSEPITWLRKIAKDNGLNGRLKELAVGEIWKL